MKQLAFYMVVLSVFIAMDCFADTITLKNSHSISGIIVEEGEDVIVLDLGCGTISLRRADIESIERSNRFTNEQMRNEWRKQYVESFPAPTPEDQKILDDFKELKYEKEKLARNLTKKDNTLKKISALQRDISQFQFEVDEIGKKIKETDPKKDVVKYNTLVVEFNSVNGELREAVSALNALQGDYKRAGEKEVGCINKLMNFQKSFEERYNYLVASSISAQQEDFYKNLKEKLESLQSDIKHNEARFVKRKEGIVVNAALNNKINIVTLIDTGSGLTVISDEIAKKLDIDYNNIKQDIKLILADGRSLDAKFVLLDSVKVGNAEAKSVEAAIIKGKPSSDIDGLLGMSFLKNFSFGIDAEKQKLIFNSL